MCGQEQCELTCHDCIQTWFNQVEIGKEVCQSHLLCPFCKEIPRYLHLQTFNVKSRDFRRPKGQWDPQMRYACCQNCSTIKPALSKECGSDEMMITKWTCGCTMASLDEVSEDVKGKVAPCCGARVSKNGGCDHIDCTCGRHFCYGCLFEAETAQEIYEHMAPNYYCFQE